MGVNRPSLANVQTVTLMDDYANGISLTFVMGLSNRQVAFKLSDGDTPSEVARAFMNVAKVIEGLEDPSRWEPAPKKTRRRKK